MLFINFHNTNNRFPRSLKYKNFNFLKFIYFEKERGGKGRERERERERISLRVQSLTQGLIKPIHHEIMT